MRVFIGAIILIVIGILATYLLGVNQAGVGAVPEEAPGWVRSAPTAQGFTFAYPESPDGAYVSFSDWPPIVEKVNEYSCSQDLSARLPEGRGDPVGAGEEIIGGETYCVTVWREGAAGSTFATYEFLTDRRDAILKAIFTVRFVQCLNYDEPERAACTLEQAEVDVHALAYGLVESTRLSY